MKKYNNKKYILITILLLITTTVFFVLIAQQASGTEIPGISNIANKIGAITNALSSTLFRVFTAMAITFVCLLAYFNIMKWKYVLTIAIVSIIVNILNTVVDFIYSS